LNAEEILNILKKGEEKPNCTLLRAITLQPACMLLNRRYAGSAAIQVLGGRDGKEGRKT